MHTTYPSPRAVDGAFDYEYVGRTDPGNVVGWIGLNKIIFDASRCSSIYGGSTTVQPPAVTVRYYIRAK